LKETVSIPVIGNGDINCGEDAARMLKETGCDAVMIGRAAMGYPWIFKEINHFLSTGKNLVPPKLEERIAIILEHAQMLIDNFGEERAMLKMRHHVAWYARGWPGVANIRQRAFKMKTYAELESILEDYKNGKMSVGFRDN
jgi:tRNA-dihydrouridine synthase